jgi:signal transduction histidine kinase
MLMGIGLGYLFGFNVLRNMVGDVHRKMSQLLASHITRVLDEEMARIKAYSEDPLWAEAVAKNNSKYEAMGSVAAKAYLEDAAERWTTAQEGDPLVAQFLRNDASVKLRELAQKDKNIAQISVIDKFGGLAAASDKVSNFYLANEERRQRFFSDPKGRIFIGDIEFDEAPRAWVVPVAIPIRDAEGSVIGVFKVELSTERLFSSLGDFKVDSTGHAVLIDGRGNIMFRPGVAEINVRLCGEKDYKRLLTSKGKFATIYEPNIHKRRAFVAFSEVLLGVLLENNITWRVLIDQDAKEVFAPLNKIVAWMALALVFLLAVMVAAGFVFSGILVKPIQALYIATVQIMRGDWDYKIDIKTGDEIEQFADAFRDMIANIKDKQEQLMRAKNELEELSKSLEKKVEERTIDLTMARDKLKNYTKELEKAIQVKSDFVSMASHELRTPLVAIREGISIVLSGKTGVLSGQQTEFLDMAKKNVDRLGRLINDILDFQKLESGKVVMKMEENDLNEVANEVCNMMMHVTKEKGLQLTTELAGNVPKVKFDRDKITQVLTNLISNAIEFTAKGTITVETSTKDNVVKLAVRDTGIGIKEEEMPEIFQKFSQLERGLERKPGGTGLGLVICKEIIERHGGKIWAESKFGEGSTFYFVLPIKERRTYAVR